MTIGRARSKKPQSPDNVCWNLYLHFLIQKKIRETGGLINHDLTLEDVRPWVRHPEYFPRKFRGKVVFLWDTTEIDDNNNVSMSVVFYSPAKKVEVWKRRIC